MDSNANFTAYKPRETRGNILWKGLDVKNEKGETYIEFHVDDSPTCTELGNQSEFGGFLSVRRPTNQKPLLIFGQDECIFKQFLFRNKCWNGPDGETPLMPKGEGQGLMVSGFVSQEYGFNWKLSKEQLEEVNKTRRDKEYIDRDSAISKNGSPKKQDLKHSPFRRDLQYGASNEGYWTYKDMIIQVEDCIDCLKAIHKDKFQYLFLFDHSNGHDRAPPDALKADAIRRNYGGKQPRMRNSTIETTSYLGPFQHDTKLNVGDVQCMTFAATDIGPFYLSPTEREA